jgi:hypothetical protein
VRTRLVLLAVICISTLGLGYSGATATAQQPQHAKLTVPVDRQEYVAAVTTTNPVDGTTIDAYGGDPSSIHIAVNSGQEFSRSFVHLALDYLPKNAAASTATMTLFVTSQGDSSQTSVYPIFNVNPGQALIEACALKTELPQHFDGATPPAYDCEHGSAVGKPNKAGTSWTFQLKNLIGYWAKHGNTGAALVPIKSGASGQTWAVSFYKSRSTSQVSYDLPAPSPSTSPTPTPSPHSGTGGHDGGGAGTSTGGTTTGGSSGIGTGGGGPQVTLPGTGSSGQSGGSSGQPPKVAGGPAPSTTGPAAQAAPSHHTTWPWVLIGCIVLAGAALGAAHRQALLARLSNLRAPGLAAFRAHPRSYSIAAASLSWGLVFSTYSLVTTTAAPTGSQGGLTATGQTATGTGTTPTGTGTGTAAGGGSGGATTGGATGTTGGRSSTSGGSTGSTSGSTGSSRGGGHHGSTAAGPATTRTIDGTQVLFPADGGPPEANLYSGSDDTIGLTSSSIRLCAHAALTYGAAFHISATDLDVWWSHINDQGGIFGRKIVTKYVNDNYDPGTAVQAAQACKDWGTFLLEGGIGFDQIPAVRQWAEQNHELYLHHIATSQGAAGLRYSFSSLPSVEQVGTWFGETAAKEFPGQKVGIIYRNSSNWEPAIAPFERAAKAAGVKIVGTYPVTLNQGNYTQQLTQLRSAGAQVVFSWENALSEIEMIKQAQAQNWHPAWLVNGFNIITNTLGQSSMDQPMWGPAEWEAYDPGYYGGGFSSYAKDIKEFEAEYRKYDPGANLKGDGGDLLFLNWEAERGLYGLLKLCGPDCTRDKIAGIMLAGFHGSVSPNCPVDFRGVAGDHHHGGYLTSLLHVVKDPNGRPNFVPVERCVRNI